MERFAFESNCRKFPDVIGTGGLFEIKAHGDHAHIIINTATEFYNRVYSLAEKDADLESMRFDDLRMLGRNTLMLQNRSTTGSIARNFGSSGDFRWFYGRIAEGVKSDGSP